MPGPATLDREISPPPPRQQRSKRSRLSSHNDSSTADDGKRSPTLAAIEAGEVKVNNHLELAIDRFRHVRKSSFKPSLSLDEFRDLYSRNCHNTGRHFVVHQHDHPISGLHYDLRLQFSSTSSLSFAIPYGLPGNPNSIRPNRMAIETRVHNLWNNVIESASNTAGSLLIWDTGEYEVLPYNQENEPATEGECSDYDGLPAIDDQPECEKLISAFRSRHIRLRLHGTRLPEDYTITLRLSKRNVQSREAPRKRTRTVHNKSVDRAHVKDETDETDEETEVHVVNSPPPHDVQATLDTFNDENSSAEGRAIRANNAYTGATNDIGSVHQRHWFLSLDRRSSGFRKSSERTQSRGWVGGFEPFFVRGCDFETSVVTGRRAAEVMADDGVRDFRGRKMWMAVLK